jgi:hypothetical protein
LREDKVRDAIQFAGANEVSVTQFFKSDILYMENKYNELLKYSNPTKVKQKAVDIFGQDVKLAVSTRKQNKYMILNPHTNKWSHFGGFNPPMSDYTKHRDPERRRRYLQRATAINGDWASNPYSSNSLSLSLLWNYQQKSN